MTMISYAQNGEDVLLNRLFHGHYQGLYVDVGANHPTLHSVTRHFYNSGWRGINIEPVPQVFALLEAERPDEINLPVAVSDHEGTMTLHEPPTSLGMATLNRDFANGLRTHGYHYIERNVTVTTLKLVCAQYVGDSQIDFMKIDVEGHEGAVIRGGDWTRWRPRVVLVEATIAPESWEPVLLEAGYCVAAFDGLNRYYVRSEDAELMVPKLQAPANVLDQFTTFEHLQELESLRAERDAALERLLAYEGLGPTATALAHRLQVIGKGWPLAGSLVRRFISKAG